MEDIMTDYGDTMLKIFHKNNYSNSSPLDWESLIA